jgi:hypothetical protein
VWHVDALGRINAQWAYAMQVLRDACAIAFAGDSDTERASSAIA